MLKRLSPQQKKLALVVGVGGLALIFLLARRSNAANATATDGSVVPANTIDPTAGGTLAPVDTSGGTMPDYSGAISDLSNQVAGLSTGLDALTQSTQTGLSPLGDLAAGTSSLSGDLQSLTAMVANMPASGGSPGQTVGQPAAASPPSPVAAPAAAKAPAPKTASNQFTQTSGPRAGQTYKVVQKPSAAHGGALYDYRDYGGGTLVPIGPASHH